MTERIKFAIVAWMLMTLTGLCWLLPLRFLAEESNTYTIAAAGATSTVVTAFSVLYIRHEFRNARTGLPMTDERTRTNRLNAGYYAFFLSAAFNLGLFAYVISGVHEVEAGEIQLVVMLAMTTFFLALWAFFTFRGRGD